MQVAIIADTHMPKGARALPDACRERLRQADLILHAGDLITTAILDQLGSYGPVLAVHGNVDDAELRARLPATQTIVHQGIQIALIHDAGPRQGRLNRLKNLFPDTQAVVFGHSHLPLHERAEDGFQIFNPGSPTERRRAPHRTMGIARIANHQIDFELITLD